MITIASSEVEAAVDPAAGATLIRLSRPGGPNVLAEYAWETPVPAARTATFGDSESDWLSGYRGGWHELFPNTGDRCTVSGVPLPFHGEASTSEWAVVDTSSDRLSLRCATRLPLILERTMTVRDATLRLDERVRADADGVWPFIWGHHPAFAATPETAIDLPPCRVVADASWDMPFVDVAPGETGQWPRLPVNAHWPGPSISSVDLSLFPEYPVERLCFVPELPQAWAAIRGLAGRCGVALAWDREAFPHLWLWWQAGGLRFPWYGRACVVAVEPQSTWPADGLAAAIRRGDAHSVGPDVTVSAWLEATLFDSDEGAVSHVGAGGVVVF